MNLRVSLVILISTLILSSAKIERIEMRMTNHFNKLISDLKQNFIRMQYERLVQRRKKEKQAILYRKMLRSQLRTSRF
jgi:hypothetical protein